MNRRSFLAGILAAGVAPAIVRASSLMPWRVTEAGVLHPEGTLFLGTDGMYIWANRQWVRLETLSITTAEMRRMVDMVRGVWQ